MNSDTHRVENLVWIYFTKGQIRTLFDIIQVQCILLEGIMKSNVFFLKQL